MKSTKLMSLLIMLALLVSGCGPHIKSLKYSSSGETGCIPEDIEISYVDSDALGNARVWKAVCKGDIYVCASGEPVKCSLEK
ncbi:hypothetical protein SAMN02745866_04082 [Alteromonadaceae bacterium Bs31]|nr:hypothetical protein SAMN02745866_04082 [Alteromonadaceae bacterium Bs31]